MEEIVRRTRREVTETTERDEEDCHEVNLGGEVDGGQDERGRKLSRKTVTTTVRVGYTILSLA